MSKIYNQITVYKLQHILFFLFQTGLYYYSIFKFQHVTRMGKTRTNPPRSAKKIKKYFSTLHLSTGSAKLNRPTEQSWSTTKYFKLDILKQEERCGQSYVLVHYKGWPKKFNEWRLASDILEKPLRVPDAEELFRTQLAIKIKEELNGHRKKDSLVEIKIQIQKGTFTPLESVGSKRETAGVTSKYRLDKLSALNNFLGEGWHYRILNIVGDFCFITPGSVHYWMFERKPLLEFLPDHTTKLIHRGYTFTMRFVKDNGTNLDLQGYLDMTA